MSWLSEFWRWATNNPKIPAVFPCGMLETQRVRLLGKPGVNPVMIDLFVSGPGNLRVIFRDENGKATGLVDLTRAGVLLTRAEPNPDDPPVS